MARALAEVQNRAAHEPTALEWHVAGGRGQRTAMRHSRLSSSHCAHADAVARSPFMPTASLLNRS